MSGRNGGHGGGRGRGSGRGFSARKKNISYKKEQEKNKKMEFAPKIEREERVRQVTLFPSKNVAIVR